MEWEAPNPLTPSLENALVEFPDPLLAMRKLSLDLVNQKRLTLDCYGDINVSELLDIIENEHPALNTALNSMCVLAKGAEKQILPGSQPQLSGYVGTFSGDTTNKPIVNVGSGANNVPGTVSYDPLHYIPDTGRYGEATAINTNEYHVIEHDDDVPKCSRGVLQLLPPTDIPSGDQVHIVPDYEVWSENKAATHVGGDKFCVVDFQSAGGPVGGEEYDHKGRFDFGFHIGWHIILYGFVKRCVNNIYEGNGPIPKCVRDFTLTRPGRDSDIPMVSIWTEKLDGVLCHLYCDGGGKSYLYSRNDIEGKTFSCNGPAFHLLLEKVQNSFYLLGGQWNCIKLHQHPEMLSAFLSKVSINVNGVTVICKRALISFEEGMEGLIGYIPGQRQSVYFKSKDQITVDLDYQTYMQLPGHALAQGFMIHNGRSEVFENSPAIFQVRYSEEEYEIERKDGTKTKLPMRKFRATVEHKRLDKQTTDTLAKAMCLLSQRRAENVIPNDI